MTRAAGKRNVHFQIRKQSENRKGSQSVDPAFGRPAVPLQRVLSPTSRENERKAPISFEMEIEPRVVTSAVSRAGQLISSECYRCLTTVSRVWHTYGKLKLNLCNACVVLLDTTVCGYCAQQKLDDESSHLSSCALCSRPTHHACQERWRQSGPNVHSMCIVCEVQERIRARDYKDGLRLVAGDVAPVLNHHIFLFDQYFSGDGPRPRKRLAAAKQAKGTLFPQLSQNKSQNWKATVFKNTSASNAKRTGSMLSFDEMLVMSSHEQVNVQEKSVIRELEKEFTRKWDILSKNLVDIPKRAGQIDFALEKLKGTHGLQSAAVPQQVVDRFSEQLQDLGHCYLTRPIEMEAGDRRLLKAMDEIYFVFALDFNIIPDLLSKSEARDLIYKTIGENPKLSELFRDVHKTLAAGHNPFEKKFEDKSAPEYYQRLAANQQKSFRMDLAFMLFIRRVADLGRRVDESVLLGMDDWEISEVNKRQALTVEDVLVNVMHLDDDKAVDTVLSKHLTLEQVAQQQAAKQAAEAAKATETETVLGRRNPFPLNDEAKESDQMRTYTHGLQDAFNFFVDPNSEQFIKDEKDNRDEGEEEKLAKLFTSLDKDEDLVISLDDLYETFEDHNLATLVPLTFGPLAGADGISWEVFSEGGEASVGAIWATILGECSTTEERVEAGVLLLQRFTAPLWVDQQGNERREALEWQEGETPGIGALLAVNGHGQPIVARVARPGPADQKLWGGDVILEVDGESLEGLAIGEAINRVMGSATDKRPVKLLVARQGAEEEELVVRGPPPPPPERKRKTVLQRQREAEYEPSKKLPVTNLFRLLRTLGLVPLIVSEQQLHILVDQIKDGHNPARDGPMKFDWQEFVALLELLTIQQEFQRTVRQMLMNAPPPSLPPTASTMASRRTVSVRTAASEQALTSMRTPASFQSKAFRSRERRGSMSLQPLDHVEAHELPLAHLCILAKIPASEGPSGSLWIRKRFFNFADSEMAAADPSTQQTFGAGAKTSVAMMSKWETANDLVESDGMAKYLERCAEFGVKPIHVVSKKLLSLSRELALYNFPLSTPAVLALSASLGDNRHIQELTLHDVGLTAETVAMLCEALAESKQLRHLDLSENEIGFHRTVRAASYAPDGISEVARLLTATDLRVLVLQNVGLGDRDVLELAGALWKNHSMLRIDLSHNNIGDRGASQLANLVTSCDNIRVLNVTWNRLTPKGVMQLQAATNSRNEAGKSQVRRTLMPLVDMQAEDEEVYEYRGLLEYEDMELFKRHLKMLLELQLPDKPLPTMCVTILDLETNPAARRASMSRSPDRDGPFARRPSHSRRTSTQSIHSRRGSFESISFSRRSSVDSTGSIFSRRTSSAWSHGQRDASGLEASQLYDPLTGRRNSLLSGETSLPNRSSLVGDESQQAAQPSSPAETASPKSPAKGRKKGRKSKKGGTGKKQSRAPIARRPSDTRRGSMESVTFTRSRSRSVSSVSGRSRPTSAESRAESHGSDEEEHGMRRTRVRTMRRREYLKMKQTLQQDMLTLHDKLGVIRMMTYKKRLTVMHVWELLLPFYHTSMEYAASTLLYGKLPSQTDSDIVINIQKQYVNAKPNSVHRHFNVDISNLKSLGTSGAAGQAAAGSADLAADLGELSQGDAKKSAWKRARAAAVALSVQSGQQSAQILKRLATSRLLKHQQSPAAPAAGESLSKSEAAEREDVHGMLRSTGPRMLMPVSREPS